jgi:hypothetical protein
MHFQRFALLLIAVSVGTSTALAQHVSAGSTVTRDVNLPAVGLASSETAQINVVNLASASSSGTTASCTGTITFYNASGSAIGSTTSFTIGTGQISSASLPYSDTGATGRTSIRGVVTLTETAGSGVPCALASDIETYDAATGVTHVHAGGTAARGTGPGGH